MNAAMPMAARDNHLWWQFSLKLGGLILLVLSGGTGGPKLLRGLLFQTTEPQITVIVNTGDDMWISGNLVCPDLDTVVYTIAGIVTERWWGIRDDTFKTYEELLRRGHEESLIIGELDRATHIMRTHLLCEGKTLTEATLNVCRSFAVSSTVLPMTDDFVPTMIITEQGGMHIQDFLVTHEREPRVLQVKSKSGVMTLEVKAALGCNSSVIIGPSNPISSVGPILNVEGMRKALKERFVVAVSPIIRTGPVSGPAAQFMESQGLPVSSLGIAQYYEDFLDVLVVDTEDFDVKDRDLPGDIQVVRTGTIMHGIEESKTLAAHVLEIINQNTASDDHSPRGSSDKNKIK